MARTTISIPDDLKRRMDRIKEPVNWSAIAADAFELKLGEIARRQQEKTLEDVIARLRAHIVEDEMDDNAHGRRRGIDWAKETAKPGELRRLHRFDRVDMLEHRRRPGWSDKLAFSILPGPGLHTPEEAREFWRSGVGVTDEQQLSSVDFLNGFVQGALSIYEQVKSAL